MIEKDCSGISIANRPVPFRLKAHLLSNLWGSQIQQRDTYAEDIDIDPHVEFYCQQCDLFSVELEQTGLLGYDDVEQAPITKHEELLNVAAKVKAEGQEIQHVRDEIKRVHSSHPAAADGHLNTQTLQTTGPFG